MAADLVALMKPPEQTTHKLGFFFFFFWANLFWLTGSSSLGFKKSYSDPSLESGSPFFLWTLFFSRSSEELCSRRRPVNNSNATRLSSVSLRDVNLRLLVHIEDT
jgi:hypothetical protein